MYVILCFLKKVWCVLLFKKSLLSSFSVSVFLSVSFSSRHPPLSLFLLFSVSLSLKVWISSRGARTGAIYEVD